MTYDLIIVGTGFAGSFFLHKYLQRSAPRVRVLVLERGPRIRQADRLRARRGAVQLSSLGAVESADSFTNLSPDKPWAFTLGFGGSSNCWWGCTPRFLPEDFELRTRYGRGLDWPISYADLEPFYEEAEGLMQISGPDEVPWPRRSAYLQPPHALTSVDLLLRRQYGAQYIVQPTARARTGAAGRPACCGSAVCGLCPIDAKFTIENALGELYRDERVTLQLNAEVRRLDIAAGAVRGIHYYAGGEERSAAGAAVALGANALFNAAILLRSGDSNPHTGSSLCEQISLSTFVELDGLQNLGGSTSINANGYMWYAGEHRRERAACLLESIDDGALRMQRGKWRSLARFKFIFEELPEEGGVVKLGPEGEPEVHWRGTSSYVQAGLQHLRDNIGQLLGVLPVERVHLDHEPAPTEGHLLGTTRMSAAEHSGVVDSGLLHHRYRNLFVLGGGAFPAISPSNPTLTLSALSLYAAERSF